MERTSRNNDLEMEKNKLVRQKDLLIKKIKSQQKEREEGLMYAREVTRITAMLNKLTAKKWYHHHIHIHRQSSSITLILLFHLLVPSPKQWD